MKDQILKNKNTLEKENMTTCTLKKLSRSHFDWADVVFVECTFINCYLSLSNLIQHGLLKPLPSINC